MHAAILKSAALAGVMGVGCGGVWYVQHDLAHVTQAEAPKFTELDAQLHSEPAASLTGADPFVIPEATGETRDPAALASVPAANPQPTPLAAENSSAFSQLVAQSDMKAEVPGGKTEEKLLAANAPEATPAESPWARDRKMTLPAGDPAAAELGRIPDLTRPAGNGGTQSTIPPNAAKPTSQKEEIDLFAGLENSEPVPTESVKSSPLNPLPSGNPGPVLLPVPTKITDTGVKTADGAADPFADIAAEPAVGGSSIQQVQNELPQIRPGKIRSTIPTRNDSPGTNPTLPLGNDQAPQDPLPQITPGSGMSSPAPTENNNRFAPKPATEPASSNPFEFNAADPAPAAPANERQPPQFNWNDTPSTVTPVTPTRSALVPVEERPASISPQNDSVLPKSPPASTIPGNRDAIPGLGPIPNLSGSPVSPAETPAAAEIGRAQPSPSVDLIGDGVPGDVNLVGPQQPEVKIEKIAPKEAILGEPMIYEIKVRNVGRSTAFRVIVEDRIPLGSTCQGTIPQAETADKRLYWKLGNLRAGEERDIKIKLTPTQPGSIGSVATVSFAAEIAAVTTITAPELKVDLQTPAEIVVGEQATFRIQVRNSGQGIAKGVFLRALLPRGLKHPGGNDLEYEIGTLTPGQSKDVDLFVSAEVPGAITPKVILTTNNQEQDARTAEVNVIDARLQIVRNGPTKRFVGRPATFGNGITNQSGNVLRDVVVVETLPPDLEPTGKLSNGQWDPQTRTITWRIPQLASREKVDLNIDLIPRKPGTFDGSLKAHDGNGNQAVVATHVDVAGYSNLVVDVVPDGPVAVGEQVSMRLSVKNRGTAPASNVQTVFEVPGHLRFVNANGPVQHQASGNVVHFAALDAIPPGGEQQFDIVLAAAQEGTDRVKIDLYSDDHKTEPLHEEGEVRVYRD